MPTQTKPHIDIRKANPDEAGHLSALAMRSKAFWGYSAEFMAACRDELEVTIDQFECEHIHYKVAEICGEVVGFYALDCLGHTESAAASKTGSKPKSEPAPTFELDALFVEPDLIGKGIGKALMSHAKNYAASLGAVSIFAQIDPNAERFYLAAGGKHTYFSESESIPGRLLPIFTFSLANENAPR